MKTVSSSMGTEDNKERCNQIYRVVGMTERTGAGNKIDEMISLTGAREKV